MAKVVDKDSLTCNNRKCKKRVDETYKYTSYHQLAVRDNLINKEFCKECFDEKESKYRVL